MLLPGRNELVQRPGGSVARLLCEEGSRTVRQLTADAIGSFRQRILREHSRILNGEAKVGVDIFRHGLVKIRLGAGFHVQLRVHREGVDLPAQRRVVILHKGDHSALVQPANLRVFFLCQLAQSVARLIQVADDAHALPVRGHFRTHDLNADVIIAFIGGNDAAQRGNTAGKALLQISFLCSCIGQKIAADSKRNVHVLSQQEEVIDKCFRQGAILGDGFRSFPHPHSRGCCKIHQRRYCVQIISLSARN